MDRHEVNLVTREFRRMYKSIDDLERRVAATILNGRVKEIDGNRIKLELLPEDGRTGKPFLSPWVQVQEAAGATASHFPVAVGDPMRLLSPNGEIGPQSLAIRDGYTNDNPNPTDEKQQQLVLAHGGCELRMGADGFKFVGPSADFVSASLTHNQINIGETHKHTEVMPGAGLSGPPEQ